MGTATCLGPVETMSFTVEPVVAFVPAVGSVEMTRSLGTLSLASVVFVTLKPAASRVCWAAFWPWPVTSGIAFLPGPRETVSVTVEPSSALSSAIGSCARTVPTFLLDVFSLVSVEALLLQRLLGAGLAEPTTSGTTCLGALSPVSTMASTTAAMSNAARPPQPPFAAVVLLLGERVLLRGRDGHVGVGVGARRRQVGLRLLHAVMNCSSSLVAVARVLVERDQRDLLELGRDHRVELRRRHGRLASPLSAMVTALSPSNGTRPVSSS